MTIAGVLLAAGAGARFGGNKLQAPLPAPSHGVPAGTPIGVAACLHLVAALGNVVAVVRPGDRALAAALRDAGARVVECPRSHEGMGASLACGVAAAGDATGWIVALADMPLIAPATIAQVAQRLAETQGIVIPALDGRRGHPVGFGASWRGALLESSGDVGARQVIESAGVAVLTLAVVDRGVVRDIDSPQDLADASG